MSKTFILIYLSFFLFAISLSLKGQQITTLNDTANISYIPYLYSNEIDSVVFLKNKNPYIPTIVFFDTNKTKLAYKSVLHSDTCITYDYWRNGTLKTKNIILINKDTFIWLYEAAYCKNGQLLWKWFPDKINGQHIIDYYCNGQKKSEFDLIGIVQSGLRTDWYENGNKKSESYFKPIRNNSRRVKIGNWKFYDEKGMLDSTEVFKNDTLINTFHYKK